MLGTCPRRKAMQLNQILLTQCMYMYVRQEFTGKLAILSPPTQPELPIVHVEPFGFVHQPDNVYRLPCYAYMHMHICTHMYMYMYTCMYFEITVSLWLFLRIVVVYDCKIRPYVGRMCIV